MGFENRSKWHELTQLQSAHSCAGKQAEAQWRRAYRHIQARCSFARHNSTKAEVWTQWAVLHCLHLSGITVCKSSGWRKRKERSCSQERVISSLIKESTKRSESLGTIYRAVNKQCSHLLFFFLVSEVRMEALLCPSLIAGFSLERPAVHLCKTRYLAGRQAGRQAPLPFLALWDWHDCCLKYMTLCTNNLQLVGQGLPPPAL